MEYSEDIEKICSLCPRNCRQPRKQNALTFCGDDGGTGIASICIHTGEEPAISGNQGICNVFFSGCNMRCVYCQNDQISRKTKTNEKYRTYHSAVSEIEKILQQGIPLTGFVSPSHRIPQMVKIIQLLKQRGNPTAFVYNSNGYDKPETLNMLEGMIDVYLPDFKYSDDSLAVKYSGAPRYHATALAALKEMYRQKGSSLVIDKQGYAIHGIIVRHLVLPGQTANSIGVLKTIADEVSTDLHISLMSQYYPAAEARNIHELNRPVNPYEYEEVVEAMLSMGFHRGWIQSHESQKFYRPDFTKPHPFGN